MELFKTYRVIVSLRKIRSNWRENKQHSFCANASSGMSAGHQSLAGGEGQDVDARHMRKELLFF